MTAPQPQEYGVVQHAHRLNAVALWLLAGVVAVLVLAWGCTA